MTSSWLKKLWPVLLSALCLYLSCAGTGKDDYTEVRNRIAIKGSDTMLYLVQRWAEAYMKQHPGHVIYAEGGGSKSGIKELINGRVDIAASSRPWQPDEIRQLVEKQGSLGIAILTARDALTIYLHPDNPVRELTLEQVKAVFTGRITNWESLGGSAAPIQVASRSPNSGTHLFLEEHVLEGESYTPDAAVFPTTEAIIQYVTSHSHAIGYGGMAYGKELHHAMIESIEPTPENVRNGTYPISRYLYLYTVRPPTGVLKTFIDWVLSREGQTLVEQVGYIPLYNLESE